MSAAVKADVVVVGAGPAGLAAAVAAAECGATVIVVDAGTQPGGQYWRHAPEHVTAPDGHGHHDWRTYKDLRARFDAAAASGSVSYFPGSLVWMAERDEDGLGFLLRTTPTSAAGSSGGQVLTGKQPAGPSPRASSIEAGHLVFCPGGYDRQLPVPGWDLPGVMAAGGIQAFIKANRALPGRRFVIAGTGPFLLPVAAAVAHEGGKVVGVLESSSLRAWVPHLRAVAGVPGKAFEGIEYAAAFARHRISYRTRTVVTEVLGDNRVEGVRTMRVDTAGKLLPGSERTYGDVDVVGFGWGFTPQVELPISLGAATRTDVDGSLVCVVDGSGESSVPGLFLAGEVTGVGGAVLAVLEGLAAGRAAAGRASGTAARSEPMSSRAIRRYRRFASAMHQAHPVPAGWQSWLTDQTIICRCEEVTTAQIKAAGENLGAADARSLKSFTRVGMGWCQGRVCGYAASCLAAGIGANPSRESLTSVAKRPLAAPISLGHLASLDASESSTLTEGTTP